MAFTIDLEQLRTRAANAARPASPASPASDAAEDQGGDPYAAFQGHFDALLALGLIDDAAFDIAEAVCLELEQGGDRHVCALECRQYRRGCCMKPRAAGVPAQLGDLAFIPQRCAAFESTR